MELDFALLTEKADPSPSGTLHLWGAGFEGLNGPAFPCAHQFSVIVKMQVRQDELDRSHHIRLEVIDPDGDAREILSDTDARLNPAKNRERPIYATFILGVAFVFGRPGLYTFRFFVDGREMKSWPIYLDQLESQQPEETS